MTSQRVDPEEHPAVEFLRRHDAFLQVLVTILGHAYGTSPHDLFLLTRASMHDRWASFGTSGEDVRVIELTLQVTRTARGLGSHGPDRSHPARPAPPPSARSVLAARGFEPAWRHPDPWRLLAADEARPLRALVHLDPLARDLAVLRWLGVPDTHIAPELGVGDAELPERLAEAMRQWSTVVAAATGPDPEPGPGGRHAR